MITVFFSYSHKDEAFRDELETHLSALKRQGVIATWHDRRIGAGREVHKEISESLEKADIILLLVSPYFIASDYCYEVEMTRALERHDKGEARVIPVILHPCDWQATLFGKLLAVPGDGKPVSKFPNQHDAFLQITKAIKVAAQELTAASPAKQMSRKPVAPAPSTSHVTAQRRSSNLRIKKQFTDHDKDKFLDDTFEYMANFFEGSLTELQARNPGIETRFKRIDANRFEASIYRNGNLASYCGIRQGQDSFTNGIAYSSNSSSGHGSFNELLSVGDDGHTLFLKPLGMQLRFSGQSKEDQQLTQQGAAEAYWDIFIEPLQR
jgi:hypothetical protein